jgi:RNA polymerase subunit RPABC4/transcription elongation factor Spt4
MAFCPNCGKEVSPQATFCPNCGKPIQSTAAPAQAFCPHCGSPVDPAAEICPKCGVRIKQPPQAQVAGQPSEDVSVLYWLLPFFFGILGGIVAYIVLKDRNRKTATYILIFGLVWTLVGFVFAILLYAFVTGLIGGLTATSFTVTYTYAP